MDLLLLDKNHRKRFLKNKSGKKRTTSTIKNNIKYLNTDSCTQDELFVSSQFSKEYSFK